MARWTNAASADDGAVCVYAAVIETLIVRLTRAIELGTRQIAGPYMLT